MSSRGLLRATCSLLLALYPAAWRARYRDEVEDVLDQHRITTATVVDLATGALRAHRHTEHEPDGASASPERHGSGVASLVMASLLFAVGWALALRVGYWTGFWIHDQDNPLRVGVRLLWALGAASLLAVTAATITVFVGAMVWRASARGRSGRLVALVVPLAASVALLAAAVLAPRVDASPPWATQWQLVLVPWGVAMAVMARAQGGGSSSSNTAGRVLVLGRLGVLGMAATLAAGVLTTAGIALGAPQLGAPLLAMVLMAMAVTWAAAALRRVGASHHGRRAVA